jgi:hypothetical protein
LAKPRPKPNCGSAFASASGTAADCAISNMVAATKAKVSTTEFILKI